MDNTGDTRDEAYARRLQARSGARWKKVLNVQAPYRWNLRRQGLGRTIDVGCGIGRNLEALSADSIGVDHNADSVAVARAAGLKAMTWDEFVDSEHARPGAFDSMLVAHVIEHMSREDAAGLLTTYLPFVKPGGKVFMVCPQERGYKTDHTHVEFTTGEDLEELSRSVGLTPKGWFSFPFPRFMGKAFTYNEFCLLSVKNSGA